MWNNICISMDVEMILEIFYTFTRFCAFFSQFKTEMYKALEWFDKIAFFPPRCIYQSLMFPFAYYLTIFTCVFFWSILGSFLSFLKEGFFYLLHLQYCCSTFSSFISICLEKGKIWKHFLPIKTVNINNCI